MDHLGLKLQMINTARSQLGGAAGITQPLNLWEDNTIQVQTAQTESWDGSNWTEVK